MVRRWGKSLSGSRRAQNGQMHGCKKPFRHSISGGESQVCTGDGEIAAHAGICFRWILDGLQIVGDRYNWKKNEDERSERGNLREPACGSWRVAHPLPDDH